MTPLRDALALDLADELLVRDGAGDRDRARALLEAIVESTAATGAAGVGARAEAMLEAC
jgi:hypothetical protein